MAAPPGAETSDSGGQPEVAEASTAHEESTSTVNSIEIPLEGGRRDSVGSNNTGAQQAAQPTSLPPQPPPPPGDAKLGQKNSSALFKLDRQFDKILLDDAQQNNRLTTHLNGYSSSFAKCPAQPSASLCGSSGGRNSSSRETKMRFLVCSLGLISLAMSQMSRMVLNQSIVQMVEQVDKKTDVSTDGSCPWPEEDRPSATTSLEPEVMDWSEGTTSSLISPEPPVSTANTIAAQTSSSCPVKAAVDRDSDVFVGSTPPAATIDEEDMRELPDFEKFLTDEADGLAQSTGTTRPAPAAAANPLHPRYEWTIGQQSVLLGGFYYSYFIFMVLGGRMAEIYGAKYVILLSVAGSAVINLATPWMAAASFPLLVGSRVVMGAIQAGVFPGMYALIAKWLTMTEASIYAPLIKMNLRLGMVLGSMIPGVVSGWTHAFYMTGLLSAIWCVLWLLLATSDPADNNWVSAGELQRINRKKRKIPTAQQAEPQKADFEEVELKEVVSNSAITKGELGDDFEERPPVAPAAQPKLRSTPWLEIITAPSVIGLIVVKLTMNYALDFMAIMLPSYLQYVHHVKPQESSAILSTMFSIQVFLIVFVGWLAKVIILKRPFDLTKTAIRKLFQGLASFGLATCFLLLTFNDCNILFVTLLLQIISFLCMFAAGGETMLPYDLSDEYPATIMAIANSIANVSGITTTTVAGLVLGDQGGSYDRWNTLMYLIVAFNLVGGCTFTFLVRAEPIKFKRDKVDGRAEKGADLERAAH